MFNLKEWIFGPKKESEANKFKYKMNEVFIGKEYFIDYKNKNNPFADDFIAYVTVLNVKDGWVQYKSCRKATNTIYSPSSKKISDFLSIYTLFTENPKNDESITEVTKKPKNDESIIVLNAVYYIPLPNDNPFVSEKIPYVTVLNVKDGWVQYKCGGKKHNSIFDPSSKRIEDFTRIFKISPEQNV